MWWPQVAYSHGGQYLAATTGLTVVVYDAYSMVHLRSFAGHIGAVHQVAWSLDDRALCSAGDDGAAYAWDVEVRWSWVEEWGGTGGGGPGGGRVAWRGVRGGAPAPRAADCHVTLTVTWAVVQGWGREGRAH